MFWFEISIILVLVVLNGLFSMSELAVVSARKARLQADAKAGQQSAVVALELIRSPHRFLSTVQIGITLIGILAGVYGGARVGQTLATFLRELTLLAPYADMLGYASVVIIITYLSLVVGELLPKRLALTFPEAIAKLVSRPMRFLSRLFSPLVYVLEVSTAFLFKLLPFRAGSEMGVTEEEIRLLIAQGRDSGTVEQTEEQIVTKVFRLGDRPAVSVMTPRNELVWVDVNDDAQAIWRTAVETPHSYFPVGAGSIEQFLGVISIKDLAVHAMKSDGGDLRSLVREVFLVPSTVSALTILEGLKQSRKQLAVVIDEYGGVEGIVTAHDLLEAMVGDFSDHEDDDASYVRREDGSILLDGMLDLEEAFRLLKLPAPDAEEHRGYHSVGGFVMAELGRIPTEGEKFHYGGMIFEVLDMDNKRVDKVMAIPAARKA